MKVGDGELILSDLTDPSLPPSLRVFTSRDPSVVETSREITPDLLLHSRILRLGGSFSGNPLNIMCPARYSLASCHLFLSWRARVFAQLAQLNRIDELLNWVMLIHRFLFSRVSY